MNPRPPSELPFEIVPFFVQAIGQALATAFQVALQMPAWFWLLLIVAGILQHFPGKTAQRRHRRWLG